MKRLTSNIEGLSARQLAQRCIGAEELSNGRERKLALGDDILMSVSSPARYVGGEVNSVMKTLTPGMVRFAMCFPDVYEIGMSHLGIQILYDMFNRYDDGWCERVWSGRGPRAAGAGRALRWCGAGRGGWSGGSCGPWG